MESAKSDRRAIEERILIVRGLRVMLDEDLARLYAVPVKVLNQAVRRNMARFPSDFMFKLRLDEQRLLRSQIVTLDEGRGRHRKYPPLAFTEQGVAMLSSVLRSSRAVRVNIEIVRAFVRLRAWLAGNESLARKVAEMEQTYNAQFRAVFAAIAELATPVPSTTGRIGFRAD